MQERAVIFLQWPASLAILIWVPGNLGKLFALLLLWAVTFGRLSRSEWVFGLAACLFFTAMNVASLRSGIFMFTAPDVLGMPAYELFMWGFYLLHTMRMLDGQPPHGRSTTAWALALSYSLAFATIPSASALLAVTGGLLLLGLVLFHEPHDLAYVAYMILLGSAFEYTGVRAGLWHYPGDPPGGVPFWFVTLWGGVGLFARRLGLRFVVRNER